MTASFQASSSSLLWACLHLSLFLHFDRKEQDTSKELSWIPLIWGALIFRVGADLGFFKRVITREIFLLSDPDPVPNRTRMRGALHKCVKTTPPDWKIHHLLQYRIANRAMHVVAS